MNRHTNKGKHIYTYLRMNIYIIYTFQKRIKTHDSVLHGRSSRSLVSWNSRIHWLYFWWGVKRRPSINCPRYDTKPSDEEVAVLELWGMWSTCSLLLLSFPLWLDVVIPVRAWSTGQIELFNHLLYLKPFNCVQTNELLVRLKNVT